MKKESGNDPIEGVCGFLHSFFNVVTKQKLKITKFNDEIYIASTQE